MTNRRWYQKLAWVILIAMLVGLVPNQAPVYAADSITVYVTIGDGGTTVIGNDPAATVIAQAPVTVTDENASGGYDVDDVLYCLHEQYYSGGASAGYSVVNGAWGLSISSLWGDTSGFYGYWVNDASAFSLSDSVYNGDYVTAYIYKDQSGFSDEYGAFSAPKEEAITGETLELTLSTYDWGTNAYIPCEGADVSILGKAGVETTDVNGRVSLTAPDAGTYKVVATKANGLLVPAVCELDVSPMTVYLTASYEGEALEATGNGTLGASVAGDLMIQVPIELNEADATIEDAMTNLAKAYCRTTTDGAVFSSFGGPQRYISDYWYLSAGGTTTSLLGSAVLVNEVEQTFGVVNTIVKDGDEIQISLYDYLLDWSGTISPSYLGDANGDFLGNTTVTAGTILECNAYSAAGTKIAADDSIYVTTDPKTPGTALSSSTYTFDTSGTYYVLGIDDNAGTSSANYGLAAAIIKVKPVGGANAAPVRKSGVAATTSAITYVGKTYALSLGTIFEDANKNPLTYQVSENGGAYTATAASYSITPTTNGAITLEFRANDGVVYSTDTYTVTLTAQTAPASAVALSALTAAFTDQSSVLPFSSGTTGTQWAIADLMAYQPSSVSTSLRQAYVDYIVYNTSAASSAAELARTIITLKSLGLDATRIDKDGANTYFNAVSAMNDKIDATSSIYTLPYLLIALEQYGTTYSVEAQQLVDKILDQEISGGGFGYGTTVDPDAIAPVLLALAPYYGDAEVKTVVDQTVALLSGFQGSNGGILSWGAENPASTGLMIAGLAALGLDPDTCLGAKSLTDGLLLQYDETTLFGNIFNNEQSLRGLAAASGYENAAGAYRLWDFSANASAEAQASAYYEDCLVAFNVIPTGSVVVVKNASGSAITALSSGNYDLEEGSYTYTVSKSGYTEKSGSVTVSAAEAAHGTKSISVSLASAPSSEKQISVRVLVKTHDDHATGTYTLKDNASVYYNIADETVTLTAGSTAFDALVKAMEAADLDYSEDSYGYISEIDGIKEMDHGSNSGWLYRVGTTTPTTNSRDYTLSANSTVTWFFTDDYTQEYGSESWSSSSTTVEETAENVAASATTTATTNSVTGTASAALSGAELTSFNKALSASADSAGAIAQIEVETSASAKGLSLTIPKTAVDALGNTQKTALEIASEVCSMTFDAEAVATLCKDGKDLVISAIPANRSELDEGTLARIGDRPLFEFSITAGNETISDFNGGIVTVSLPYTLSAEEDPNAVVVWYVDSNGTLKTIRGAYDETTKSVVFRTGHFSKYVIGYNAPNFADVTKGAWYDEAVTFLAARGITSGTGAGNFEPNKTLSRAEFLVMLMRAFDVTADANATDNFSDAGNTYYTGYLAAAKRLGITEGIGGNRFAPEQRITRQDMCSLLYRAMEVLGEDVPAGNGSASYSAYQDTKDVSTYAETAVKTFVASGILSGSNEKLDPKGSTTRAQMAQVLKKLLEE